MEDNKEKTSLHLVYSSKISKLCSVNQSFDSAKMRIAYTGLNRNNSFISKESFMKNIKTLFNCPIVTNYHMGKKSKDDSLGGHDIKIVERDDDVVIINDTTPLGVVPESADYWFETIVDDGVVHEYLCCDVLIWKRQPVYEYIKNHNGLINESMEIDITDGYIDDDGHYRINDFCFTAFCLLGDDIEPCFESAGLSANFEKMSFTEKYEQMMSEIKNFEKGGNPQMEKELEKDDGQECSLEEPTVETIENFEKAGNEVKKDIKEDTKDTDIDENFDLNQGVRQLLYSELDAHDYIKDDNGYSHQEYFLSDFDSENKIVFYEKYTKCKNRNKYLLFGSPYEVQGNNAVIDYEQEKPAKYTFELIDDENSSSRYFESMSDYEKTIDNLIKSVDEISEKYNKINDEIENNKKEKTLSKFADVLGDNEDYIKLMDNHKEFSVGDIEAKCFEILGKESLSKAKPKNENENKSANFSVLVQHNVGEKDSTSDENITESLYGGIISKWSKK